MGIIQHAVPLRVVDNLSLEHGSVRAGESRPIGRAKIPSLRQSSRLAAILVADTVAYSHHMEQDETGTHTRLATIFRNLVEPTMAREDGRIVKSTGDGFLAEFKSATRAAWFATEFQGAVRASNVRRCRNRSLNFRIGISLGDVIIEGYDVFGHVVNVASRLQTLADPGGVLVSHAVSLAVRDRGLVFEDAGDLALKNMKETVRAFRLHRSDQPIRGRQARQRSSRSNGVLTAEAGHL